MVQHTRLDCVVASAGLIRRCVAEVSHHAAHRQVFGSTLSETPIMKNVIADLAVESEASTALAFRIAASFDAARDDPAEAAFGRIATAIGKFYICKRAPHVAFEAMECLGGNGYIEQGPMARIYRRVTNCTGTSFFVLPRLTGPPCVGAWCIVDGSHKHLLPHFISPVLLFKTSSTFNSVVCIAILC